MQEEINLTTILDKLLPMIGVIIGGVLGLLTPYLSEKISKTRRKRELKYDLIENVYLLYCYYKLQFAHSNIVVYNSRLILVTEDKLASDQLNKTIERDIERYNQHKIDSTVQADKAIDKINTVESKLIRIQSEMHHFYPEKICNSVEQLLEPTLRTINEKDHIYDYDEMDEEQLIKISPVIIEKIYNKSYTYQEQCRRLVKEIRSILNWLSTYTTWSLPVPPITRSSWPRLFVSS